MKIYRIFEQFIFFVHFSFSHLLMKLFYLKLILSKLPREDVVSYFSTLPLNDNVVKQLSQDYWIPSDSDSLCTIFKSSWQLVEFIIFVLNISYHNLIIDYHRKKHLGKFVARELIYFTLFGFLSKRNLYHIVYTYMYIFFLVTDNCNGT